VWQYRLNCDNTVELWQYSLKLYEKYGLVPGVKYVYFTKFEKSDESNVRIIDIFDNFDADLSSHSEMHYINSMLVKLRFLEDKKTKD
jgi:hypothetical protein